MKMIIIVVGGLVAIGTVYALNTEKLHTEYWLQRQIDNLEGPEGREKAGDQQETILYKFEFVPSIDIAVELDSEGNMVLVRHSRSASDNIKTYTFKIDKKEFKNLKDDFRARWKESIVSDEDDKFGGIYYVLEMTDVAFPEQSITVAFYNVTPDKKFNDFKNKIIQLAKNELKK